MKIVDFLKRIFLFLLIPVILISCNDDSVVEEPVFKLTPPSVFVVNEGNFTFGNSSLTYFNFRDSSVIQNLFYLVNKVPLGDVANFMKISNGRGYIVVNNSGIVYEIDIETGTFMGKITGLVSPREILILDNGKALISDLVEHVMSVVDLSGNGSLSKIDLDGYTSESMVEVNDKVYAGNWSGLYQDKKNDQVLVIDAASLKLTDSIRVTLEPNSLLTDKNGDLWVLCSGGYLNEEYPALYKINTEADTVMRIYRFDDKMSNPVDLKIDAAGEELYYLDGSVFSMNISAASLPEEPLIEAGSHHFYALGVDPATGRVMVSDALDYTQKGKVLIYDRDGAYTGEFLAGITPGYFAFYE